MRVAFSDEASKLELSCGFPHKTLDEGAWSAERNLVFNVFAQLSDLILTGLKIHLPFRKGSDHRWSAA